MHANLVTLYDAGTNHHVRLSRIEVQGKIYRIYFRPVHYADNRKCDRTKRAILSLKRDS